MRGSALENEKQQQDDVGANDHVDELQQKHNNADDQQSHGLSIYSSQHQHRQVIM